MYFNLKFKIREKKMGVPCGTPIVRLESGSEEPKRCADYRQKRQDGKPYHEIHTAIRDPVFG